MQAAFQPLFLCPICLRKLHKVLKFSLKERYLHLAQLCDNLNQLLSSSATSSSPDGPSSELDGVPEKQSSQAAAAAAAAAAVENVVRNSAEEHGKPTTIQLDEELLESPSVHFRQASEWLQTSIASLDRFVEQVGADSSVDSLRYEFLELHQ